LSTSDHTTSPRGAPATRSLHGFVVPDPHRWLEEPGDPAVQRWVESQDQAARDFLSQCESLPFARSFLERNHVVVDPLWHARRGEQVFDLVRRTSGSQPVLRVRTTAGEERVLLDPNDLGFTLRVEQIAVSPSGRHVTFMRANAAEVLGALCVLDCTTGKIVETSDFLTVMPVVAWHPSETGFYYSLCRRLFEEHGERIDGVYWHALGSEWSADPCIKRYHEGPGHLAYATVAADGAWLLLQTLHFSSGRGGATLRRLGAQPETSGSEIELFTDHGERTLYLGSHAGQLYFQTGVAAPNGRVVAIGLHDLARDAWRDIVPETETALAWPEHFGSPLKAAVSRDGLLLTYVEDAHDTLRHFALDGEFVRRLAPPTLSTVAAVTTLDGGFQVWTQSFLEPRCTWEYRPSDAAFSPTARIAMPDVNPGDFVLEQVFYPARDGVPVPMYLLHRRDAARDGSNPTLLYGYGGFGQSITPEYSPEVALWLALGGVYALANIRGGGEYGERWRAAGTGLNKQTSFDDFHAAGDYLVASGWTQPAQLVARGISNGGLLTAVSVNQRPDLFAAVVSELPLCDVLWLSGSATGQALTAEFGNPETNREVFASLRAWSPLQNVNADGRAPPQLVVVAECDVSAPPAQAYRYVAVRQDVSHTSEDYAPVLMRLVRGEAHGDWSPESTRRTLAEEIAFLWHFARVGRSAQVRQLRDLRVPMRDGTSLSLNAWRPAGVSRAPVVLLRTPYRYDCHEFERLGLRTYVEAGYAVAMQSVRGRGASDGQFGFFFAEGADGYDTVEWLATQPWCNGQVAMDGGSYLGTAQWLAARDKPPHLSCILPAVPAGDWFNEIPYMGGALQVDWAFSWLGAMAGLEFDLDATGARNLERYRPLTDAPGKLGAELPLYREILEHPTLDDWWRPLTFTQDDFAGIDIPVFAVTGWFDGDQAGSLHYWAGIENHSRHRASAELVIGPWEHRQCYLGGETSVGELETGAVSVLPLRQMRLAFLDEHLRGRPRDRGTRVRVFTTGDNRWRGFDRYPPAEPGIMSWYLGCGGHANTSRGDGRLDAGSAGGPPDQYTFDPRNPVSYRPGARDHREIEARADVLVYTSDALASDLTVIGPVEALLHAASTAPDTDFTAKLLDVFPDGRAVSLTHVGGVLRARCRNGYERHELLTPGKPETFRIRMSHVGHTFRAGHRLRLEVSSSCFPMIDPNPNTGRAIATETEVRTAGQTVFHDPDRPSQLRLPVWRHGR
jgi:putative CocE/NonD family hydrolase